MFPDGNYLLSIISILAVVNAFIPVQLQNFVHNRIEYWANCLSRRWTRYTVVDVPEDLNDGFMVSEFYREVEVYLSSLEAIHDMDNLRVHRGSDTSRFSFSLPPEGTIEDTFKGAQLLWTHHATEKPETQQQQWWNYRGRRESTKENRSFSLKLLRADRTRLLSQYFDHISAVAKHIERCNTQRKLHTNVGLDWEEVDFKHPSTFDTLALVPELKEQIKSDLKAFSEGEVYYHNVGRAWKRGYLLYGPPGTGKSSMIAAMSNFLQYDIYDLELTGVSENSSLKTLLMQTKRKSIIVIEDIDCSLDLTSRAADLANNISSRRVSNVDEKPSGAVTLSGLLNFTDGLWSCCGEERIFVFTTNHKERLDPALLRSGRMDFHILLPYCTFPAFKVLAANYLGVQEHELYAKLEEKLRNNSKLTPAEVVELLISNKQKPEAALHKVIAALTQVSDESNNLCPTPDADSRSRSPRRRSTRSWLRSLKFPKSSTASRPSLILSEQKADGYSISKGSLAYNG